MHKHHDSLKFLSIHPSKCHPQAASIVQKTDPIAIAKIPNAKVVILSMIAPETIEAAVHENSKNAAQNTPLMWSPKLYRHKF